MHKRRFLLNLSIIAICSLVFSTLVAADAHRSRLDIGRGGVSGSGNSDDSSQASATVIIKCVAGIKVQSRSGETESQNGNCFCTQSSSGDSSCSCSSSTEGLTTLSTSGLGDDLVVEGIYTSADFSAGVLDEVTGAESCANAVQTLHSGGADCQFSVGSFLWYTCRL